MPILTASEVTVLSDISATAGTIIAGDYIKEVTQKINLATNNYFISDIYFQGFMTFDKTLNTITVDSSVDLVNDYGFVDGDEFYIAGSYRNDKYVVCSSVSNNIITLATGYSVVSELSGRSILISLVDFPLPLKRIAAQMIAYDYDKRNEQSSGIKSHSLGPFSETFANTDNNGNGEGYPASIMDLLISYRVARCI
jgi:hypothetical protein